MPEYVLALSARTGPALAAMRSRLAEALAAGQPALPDVVTTLAEGRQRFPVRWAAVVTDLSTAVAALRGDPLPAASAPAAPVPGALVPAALEAAALEAVGSAAAEPGPAEPMSAAERAARWCRGEEVFLVGANGGRRIRLPGYAFHRGPRPPAKPVAGRPLSAHEQRLLFLDLVRAGSNAEHAAVASAEVCGEPDPAALREVFALAQRQRPWLRTVFRRVGERWLAAEQAEPAGPFTVVGLDPGTDPAAARRAALADFGARPFPVQDAPMLRGLLGLAPDGRHLLAVAAHRAVADEETVRDLLAELTTSAVRHPLHQEDQ
jgi:hypothetical protein